MVTKPLPSKIEELIDEDKQSEHYSDDGFDVLDDSKKSPHITKNQQSRLSKKLEKKDSEDTTPNGGDLISKQLYPAKQGSI